MKKEFQDLKQGVHIYERICHQVHSTISLDYTPHTYFSFILHH
jgi:hypothetical protein